jgi:hypothetical protein
LEIAAAGFAVPGCGQLLEYRTMQKALTSYGQNMIEFVNPENGPAAMQTFVRLARRQDASPVPIQTSNRCRTR